MSVAATLPSPGETFSYLKDGFYAAVESVQQLTHRDRSRAAAAIIEQVARVGDVEYAGEPRFLPPTEVCGPRIDQVVGVQVDGRLRQTRYTHPLSKFDRSGEVSLLFPGILGDPNVPGTAFLHHEKTSEKMPHADTISMNTPGVSSYGPRLPLRQIFRYPFAQMAREDILVAHKLIGDRPVHGIGNSMGGLRLAHVAFQNLEMKKLTFQDLSFVKAALVTPDEALKVCVGEFYPDYIRKSVAQEGGWAAYVRSFYYEPPHVPSACIGNIIQLSHGIEEEQLHAVDDTGIPVGLQAAAHDKLNRAALYARMVARNPGNVHVVTYPYADHSISDHIEEVIDTTDHFMRLGHFPVTAEQGMAA